jgi:hypothetical protein
MLRTFITYGSCLFGGGEFNDLIRIEDCEVFNDRVTDKFERIWKEVVVLSRYRASICLEGLRKTITTLLLFTDTSGKIRNSFENKSRTPLCATFLSACVGKSEGKCTLIILKWIRVFCELDRTKWLTLVNCDEVSLIEVISVWNWMTVVNLVQPEITHSLTLVRKFNSVAAYSKSTGNTKSVTIALAVVCTGNEAPFTLTSAFAAHRWWHHTLGIIFAHFTQPCKNSQVSFRAEHADHSLQDDTCRLVGISGTVRRSAGVREDYVTVLPLYADKISRIE